MSETILDFVILDSHDQTGLTKSVNEKLSLGWSYTGIFQSSLNSFQLSVKEHISAM